MHESYEDITSRIAEEPTWYDSNGTPRYGKFTPDRCPNIYSHCVALLQIACQSCGEKFDVEMHTDIWSDRESIPKKWHYGDPPRHVCGGGGDTMNCEDLVVLEVWNKSGAFNKWRRLHKLEGLIE